MHRFLVILMAAGCLYGQAGNALVNEAKFSWTVVRDNLLKMAEKMPAENYAFKPVPEIESFGQRIAHIAGANLRICQSVNGEDKPFARPNATSKPDLIALLKQSNAACDAVFASLNDTTAAEKINSRL